MHTKKHAVSALALAATVAVAAIPLTACATSKQLDNAMASADAAIAKAKANDWIWRDTEKFLGEAKKAAEAGDKQKAMELANRARAQAEIAISQYEIEQGIDRSSR